MGHNRRNDARKRVDEKSLSGLAVRRPVVRLPPEMRQIYGVRLKNMHAIFRRLIASGCAVLVVSAVVGVPAWTFDASFSPGLLSFYQGNLSYVCPTAVVRQADGKYIVAGGFNLVDGTSFAASSNIVRLNADGSLDASFPVRLNPGEGAMRSTCSPTGISWWSGLSAPFRPCASVKSSSGGFVLFP